MAFLLGRAFFVLAVILVGWTLSWWGPQRIRWSFLGVGTAVSAFGAGVAFLIPLLGPRDPHPICPACVDPRPMQWFVAWVLGFALCFVLLCVTVVVELIRARGEEDPAEGPLE